MKTVTDNKGYAFTLSIIVLIVLLASSTFEQSAKAKTTGIRDVKIGAFSVKVPSEWQPFSTAESDQFQRQIISQSEEIYRQYTGGSPDPAKSVHVLAFHIAGDAGMFMLASFTIPPQSDLISELKEQAQEKAKWGIQQGYIKKYLGLVPIADEQFSGFYVKCIGTDGNVEISGGLEHKNLKNTLIQMTLFCPKVWNELKATKTLTSILKSLRISD